MSFYSKKNGAVRLRGAAEKNGVAFEPYYMDGRKEIKVQGHVALDESGKIIDKVFYGDIGWSVIDYKIEKMSRKFIKKMLLVFLVLILAHIVCAFAYTKACDYIYWGAAGCCVLMLFNEAIVLNYARMKKDPEIWQFLKYLAAMNSVRNAYYKLGRVPSIREARAASTCSSQSKYLNNTFFFSFLSLVILYQVIPNLLLIGVFGALMIIFFMLELKKKIYIWQVLIYSEPYTYHYKVAIRALEKALAKVKVERVIDVEE